MASLKKEKSRAAQHFFPPASAGCAVCFVFPRVSRFSVFDRREMDLIPGLPEDLTLNVVLPKLDLKTVLRFRLSAKFQVGSTDLWSGVRTVELPHPVDWARSSLPDPRLLTNIHTLIIPFWAEFFEGDPDMKARVLGCLTPALRVLEWRCLTTPDLLLEARASLVNVVSLTIDSRRVTGNQVAEFLKSVDMPKLRELVIGSNVRRAVNPPPELDRKSATKFPRLRKLDVFDGWNFYMIAIMFARRSKVPQLRWWNTNPDGYTQRMWEALHRHQILSAAMDPQRFSEVCLKGAKPEIWQKFLNFTSLLVAIRARHSCYAIEYGVFAPPSDGRGQRLYSVVWKTFLGAIKAKLGDCADAILSAPVFYASTLSVYWYACIERRSGALPQKQEFVVTELQKLCDAGHVEAVMRALFYAHSCELIPLVCATHLEWFQVFLGDQKSCEWLVEEMPIFKDTVKAQLAVREFIDRAAKVKGDEFFTHHPNVQTVVGKYYTRGNLARAWLREHNFSV